MTGPIEIAGPPAVTAADLTLEEKAALTSGLTHWRTKPMERLGVPSLTMSDGPNGLGKQVSGNDNLGVGDAVPATCFPVAAALGSSWDEDLVRRVGELLGAETSLEDVAVLLGPGVNIKRSVLCGRNFEYFSEDPVVSGVLGTAMVRGIQSRGVGASLKHFAANNQEHDRMRASSDIAARPLREIYLRGFERVVKNAQPWTVMCSYNRINGVYASEDPWLLTQVLRKEWGFEGLVVSDWGAVEDRVSGLLAGMDLEMPTTNGVTDAEIVSAVKSGVIEEQVLDTAVDRILGLVTRSVAGAGTVQGPLDQEAHHIAAREAAGRSIVLLKNKDGLLPFAKDTHLVVIGPFAANPRFQGGGSAMMNPTRVDSALDEIRKLATGTVDYTPGFSTAPSPDENRETLRNDAVAAASAADAAIVFLGLPLELESEGYDRQDIDLPREQLELLDAVLAVNSRTVVVLSNGGVVALPFAARVPAVIEAWLLGQAGGGATADVLFGDVNPSAKLTETVPVCLEDTPAFLDFPGEFSHVNYGEGLFVGYRWYDARRLPVAFPFGHGLSYTSFEYGPATASMTPAGDIAVAVEVCNTGTRAGREIVQAYTALPSGRVQRPVRELKAFASVPLEPGKKRLVSLLIRREDLAYWDIRVDRWVVEAGEYRVDVAASSRDIRCSTSILMDGDDIVIPLTGASSIGEALEHPVSGPILRNMIADAVDDNGAGDSQSLLRMIEAFPLGRLGAFAEANGAGDVISAKKIDELIALANTPRVGNVNQR